MTFNQALNHVDGNYEAFAVMAYVSVSAVRKWKTKDYIPIARQCLIEKRTRGELKADVVREYKW